MSKLLMVNCWLSSDLNEPGLVDVWMETVSYPSVRGVAVRN